MSEGNLYNNNYEYEDRPASAPRKKKKKRGHPIIAGFFKVLGTLILIGLCTGALLLCFAAVYIQTAILPQVEIDLGAVDVNENSVMYYHDKASDQDRELVTLLTTEERIWVPYDQLPENLINATIAVEDKRFNEHHGVDWVGTGRAIVHMFTGQSIQGGSTITQQTLKNVTEYDDVTVKRKVIEIFRALWFDKTYGKKTTMEWYLNYIFLGSNCRGVGAASYEYFGKPVEDLSLAECACLIAITNNPTIYGPYSEYMGERELTTGGTTVWNARQWNKWRQETILSLMLEQGYISQAEHDEAVNQQLVFQRGQEEEDTTTIYSWYEEQVRSDVLRDLQEKNGLSYDRALDLLSRGGLRIYTCLDPAVQAQVEAIYNDTSNLNYISPTGQQLQSTISVIDNTTGDLVGIAGRLGVKEGNGWLNMASASTRQPGSSIKPLSVYGPALDMGLITPATVEDDYPYQMLNGSPWPVNVDNVYRGRVTVRDAVANSYNTVAVRILCDYVTFAKSFEYARDKFHLSTLVEVPRNGSDDFGPGQLALGGLTAGVSTLEMAAAYASFPNSGVYRNPRSYSRVEDNEGNVILDNPSVQEVAVKESTAYYINSMLHSVVTVGGGTAANFDYGMGIAGKTGTTTDKFDRWFVGYTPYYTAAVWVGYPAYNERVPASGNPAIDMWKKVMKPLHENLEDKQFPQPGGLTGVTLCADSGLRATEYCALDPRGSRTISDTLFAEDVPTDYCTVHTVESTVKICLDDPVLDENGEPTPFYHLAGPWCPEESVQEVSYLNLEREELGYAKAKDSDYLYSAATGFGQCTLHDMFWTPENEEPIYDPDDPNYQPPEYVYPTQPGDTPQEPGEPSQPEEPGGEDPGGTQQPGDTPQVPDITLP